MKLLEVAEVNDPSETFADVEPLDGDAKPEEMPRATRFATPAPSASKKPADVQRKQKVLLDKWIDDPQHPLQDKDRPMIERFCPLRHSNLLPQEVIGLFPSPNIL